MKKIFTLIVFLLISVFTRAETIAAYISEHVDIAKELMHEYKIPASLILAIAIHESAAGNSKIAKHLNNHFGVKGSNSNTDIRSAYRDYASADESYNHFAEIMQTRSPFKGLFDKYDQFDYKGWARGIQRCGYAHSRTWASQVIAIVNKYELYKYDERPDDYEEPVYAPIVKHKKSAKRKSSHYYTVKSGDNLNKIADKKGTSAKAIMQKNGLKSIAIKPGQRLKF